MYIITTGLSPYDDYICHYGRKGMKWGEHIYSRDDIKRLKKFMRTDTAKAYRDNFRDWEKEEYSKLGYKKGLLYNTVKKGSEISRYTSAKNEQVKGRTYTSMNNSHDDKHYESLAKVGGLGSESKTQYKDVYSAEKKLRVAKGKRVLNSIVKKYGDKDLKEMYKMYKDLNVHDKAGYVYDMSSGTGKEAEYGKSMVDFKTEFGSKVHNLLYKNEDVKSYVDKKYKRLGYDAIEDAEDQLYGISHPMIIYDPEKKLKKKSTRRIQ